MLKKSPKLLSELIASKQSSLGQLAAQAQARATLTDDIRNGLPHELAAELVHCSLDDDGTLTIRTSGPEWAARLRFETERLLNLARQNHPQTTQVKIRVATPDY